MISVLVMALIVLVGGLVGSFLTSCHPAFMFVCGLLTGVVVSAAAGVMKTGRGG